MTLHDIELPERWQAFQYNEVWGAWEQVIPSAADEPGVVKAYTEDQVRAAIEADRKHFAELFMDLSRYANGMYEQEYDPQMEGLSDGYGYAAEFLLGNKDVVKKLEADRKRRGEPDRPHAASADQKAQWLCKIEECADSIATADHVEVGAEIHRLMVWAERYPKPYETVCVCGEPMSLGVVHRADLPCFHYEAQQPAEPEDGKLNLDRLADYVADNWPDKKYTLEEIAQRLHATWPGAFMPAEPVKVPSDGYTNEETAQSWYDLAWEAGARRNLSFDGDEIVSINFDIAEFESFCRALLARYGKGAP